MKLGEALSFLKKEKSRLARFISLRKENIYVEEGKKTKFNPEELGQEINKRIEGIRKLKIKIQKTNLDTKVKDENISLAEALIKIGDLRSQISNLSNLFEKYRDSWLYRDKDKVEKIAQLDETKIEKEIESLEAEKVELDNKIQISNWTTELTK